MPGSKRPKRRRWKIKKRETISPRGREELRESFDGKLAPGGCRDHCKKNRQRQPSPPPQSLARKDPRTPKKIRPKSERRGGHATMNKRLGPLPFSTPLGIRPSVDLGPRCCPPDSVTRRPLANPPGTPSRGRRTPPKNPSPP